VSTGHERARGRSLRRSRRLLFDHRRDLRIVDPLSNHSNRRRRPERIALIGASVRPVSLRRQGERAFSFFPPPSFSRCVSKRAKCPLARGYRRADDAEERRLPQRARVSATCHRR